MGDKMTLTFSSSTWGGCTMSACSESQVTSVVDYSTNYCNLHDLYCGSADSCKYVQHDLTYSENNISCSSASTICLLARRHAGPACAARRARRQQLWIPRSRNNLCRTTGSVHHPSSDTHFLIATPRCAK